MTITLRATKGFELSHDELDANFTDLDARTQAGWKDLVSPLTTAGVSTANQPVMTAFGPASTPQREELVFDIGDYVFCQPFHVNHDIKADGTSKAYVHVHWSTNGTSTAVVKWEFTISRALRATGVFGTPTVITVQQAASGTAWQHMVTECADGDALTLTSPDELIIVTLRRVTNGGTDNLNAVYGLTVDFHYESNRDSSPNKASPFWG